MKRVPHASSFGSGLGILLPVEFGQTSIQGQVTQTSDPIPLAGMVNEMES